MRVAKRGFPFDDCQQTQFKVHVTEKIYNSADQRISSIHEKTLFKLRAGSREFFRGRRNSYPGAESVPMEPKECISCRKKQLCRTTCDFCDVAVCESCVRTCHSCQNTFCHMCSIVSYGERNNTSICFSCK